MAVGIKLVYRDPRIDEDVELDPIQADIYEELVTHQGLHHQEALVVAYLADSVTASKRVIKWSRIFGPASMFAEELGETKSWVNTRSKQDDHPSFWPSIKWPIGAGRWKKLWTKARIRYVKKHGSVKAY